MTFTDARFVPGLPFFEHHGRVFEEILFVGAERCAEVVEEVISGLAVEGDRVLGLVVIIWLHLNNYNRM